LIKPRLLIIEPTHGESLLNALYFLKHISSKCDIFLSSISGNFEIEEKLKHLCLHNLKWFFVPNFYLEEIPINDCLPRIEQYTFYVNQHEIYRKYYPDLYKQFIFNISQLISKVNPDYILTCLGTLYVYNVFTYAYINEKFKTKSNDKLFYYRDYPYSALYNYACVNQTKAYLPYKRIRLCADKMKYKKNLVEQIKPNIYFDYPTMELHKLDEIIYLGV